MSAQAVASESELPKLDLLHSREAFSKAFERVCRVEFGLEESTSIETNGNLTYHTLYQKLQKKAKESSPATPPAQTPAAATPAAAAGQSAAAGAQKQKGTKRKK